MMKRLEDLQVHQAIRASLAHPRSERDVPYFGDTYALADSHQVERPIQPIANGSTDVARNRSSL
jgi:hypothetical protein